MPSDCTVSKSTNEAAHAGVILFHVILSLILILTQVSGLDEKTKYIAAISVGSILLVVSILAIVPIAMGAGYEDT